MKSVLKLLVAVGAVLAGTAARAADGANGRPAVRFDGNGHLAAEKSWAAANTLDYMTGDGKPTSYVPGAA